MHTCILTYMRTHTHTQALDTARRQEQAGKEDLMQQLRKEVVRREELEAQLLGLAAKERSAEQQRKERLMTLFNQTVLQVTNED